MYQRAYKMLWSERKGQESFILIVPKDHIHSQILETKSLGIDSKFVFNT